MFHGENPTTQCNASHPDKSVGTLARGRQLSEPATVPHGAHKPRPCPIEKVTTAKSFGCHSDVRQTRSGPGWGWVGCQIEAIRVDLENPDANRIDRERKFVEPIGQQSWSRAHSKENFFLCGGSTLAPALQKPAMCRTKTSQFF